MISIIIIVIIIILLIIYMYSGTSAATAATPISSSQYVRTNTTGWATVTSLGADVCPLADDPGACIYANQSAAEAKCNSMSADTNGRNNCIGYWTRDGQATFQLTSIPNAQPTSNPGVLYLRQ